jgi:hypothetical protein
VKNLPHWFLPGLLLAAFCASKYSWLSHPYYWDEAWSYGHAVHHFAQQKLSVSPAALDPALSRGHPLLFYFSAAAWLQVTDNQLFYGHLFALLLSTLTAVTLWLIACRLSGRWAALAALATVLASQMFWALSARLYPEVMVALFSMLALWSFQQRRLGLTALWCGLLLFTKESGVATMAALFAYALWRHRRGLWRRAFWQEMAWLTLPVAAVASWFGWQYAVRGWWLFPEHTGMVVRDVGKVVSNFFQQFWALIFYDGRSVLLVSALLAAVWKMWRRAPVRADLQRFIGLAWLFIGAYLAFTAANFQTERYLVVPLVAYVLTAVLWVWEVFAQQPAVRALLLGVYVVSQVFFLKNPVRNSENTTGYLPMLRTWQAGVERCEQRQMQGDSTWTYFLMRYYMTDPHLGYLSDDNPFVFTRDSTQARYLLFDSAESGFLVPDLKERLQLRLLDSVGEGKQRVWIFER